MAPTKLSIITFSQIKEFFKSSVFRLRVWRWFIAGFAIGFAPVFLPYFLAMAQGTPFPHLYDIIKHGDTYLVCTVILIGAMSELFGADEKNKSARAIAGLISALLILFFTAAYSKMSSEVPSSSLISIDESKVIYTAFIAILCTLIIGASILISTQEPSSLPKKKVRP